MRSPTDYFNEGESVLNLLSLESGERYTKALRLFKNAANGFKNANNFPRAGESMRRVVDCYFHIDEQEEAGSSAIECARLYSKAPNSLVKMKEAFEVGINQFQDLEKFEEAARYLIEFAEIYKGAKRMTDYIDCLKRAAQIFYENEREFDGNRLDLQIATTYISLRKWKEASEQFAQYARNLARTLAMLRVNDACAKSILCLVCDSPPTLCLDLSASFEADIHTWASSQEIVYTKEIIETCRSRLESKIKKAIDAYKEAISCDSTMDDIFEGVLKKYRIR